jgi:hypothetical protein
MEECMNFLYLLLGWLLGLLSPILAERIQKPYKRKELIKSLLSEFNDLQFKMALAAYRLRSHLATVDHKFLAKLEPIFDHYDGPDKDPQATESFKKLKDLPEDQLRDLHVKTRRPGRGIHLAKQSLPFLSSQVHALSICPIDFQQTILMLKAQLDYFNDEVDVITSYFNKTFDPSITGENRVAVLANLEEGYGKLAQRAENIVMFISDLNQVYDP